MGLKCASYLQAEYNTSSGNAKQTHQERNLAAHLDISEHEVHMYVKIFSNGGGAVEHLLFPQTSPEFALSFR